MPSPDHPTNPTSTGLPEPPSGVGAADLATDSSDPEELRALLDRARERLAFYESFDRIVGENLRRSGDLMVETVALREQARTLAEQSAKDRAAFDATRKADRDRYRSLVQTALDEAASVQPIVEAMIGKLQVVLETIDAEPESSQLEDASQSPAPVKEEPAPIDEPILTEPDAPEPTATITEPAEHTTAEEKPEPEVASPDPAENTIPRTIQVLAHQVPNAKTAIALQKMLRGIDVVTNVDAREFANGELRLAVTATGSLPNHTIANWLSDNTGELTSNTESVVEMTFQM